MATTSIQWTDATWNPTTGCAWKSPGCDHCYAATMSRRLEAMGQQDYAGLTTKKHFNGVVRTLDHRLEVPLRARKPKMFFVNSMSDLFHKEVPFEFIDKVFGVMIHADKHTFQILTKRPERMAEYFETRKPRRPGLDTIPPQWLEYINHCADEFSYNIVTRFKGCCDDDRRYDIKPWPPRNIWLGTSVENQEQVDARIPWLCKTPAAVRFLSAEPLLESLDLSTWFWSMMSPEKRCAIDWVIAGGESGPGARPCQIEWLEEIRNQCKIAKVPCFIKQLGSQPMDRAYRYPIKDKKGGDSAEWPEDLRVRQWPVLA